jgi:apolipoprotein N-acyltransferase
LKPIDWIERAAGYFILSWGWKRAMLAFAAGALSALSMPPFDFFPVMFLTFPALVWLMDGVAAEPEKGIFARMRHGFSVGWCFGFGYFLAGLWWIGSAFLVDAGVFAWLLPFAVLLLPAGLALFWGLGTMLARLVWKDGFARIAALAAGLGLAEYLRGNLLTGFPWNTVGEAAMTMPLTMQKASLLGLYGVTLLAIAIFSLPALLVPKISAGGRRYIIGALVLIAADLAFGAWRLASIPQSFAEKVSIRLVQPAIDQAEKWSPDMEARNFQTLMDLSVQATSNEKQGLSGTTLLVWPETAFPFLLTERRDALSALAAMLPDGTTLVAGAVRVEPPAPGRKHELAFNSVYTIDSAGEITGAADKVHLVPFGEYLPFQDIAEGLGLEQLTQMRGGFEAGSGRTLLDGGAAGRFLPLICYEIIFPGVADNGAGRPAFILNLTNDAWFGMTPGPYQHWRQAVLRGVEAGLPVVRSANSGISSVSDAAGRIVGKIPLGVRGVVDAPLPATSVLTMYSKYGNSLFLSLLAVLFAFALIPARRW